MPRTQCTMSRSGNSVSCTCSNGSKATGSCTSSGSGTHCSNPCK